MAALIYSHGKHTVIDNGRVRRKRAGEGACNVDQYTSLKKTMRAMRRGKLPVIAPLRKEQIRHINPLHVRKRVALIEGVLL